MMKVPFFLAASACLSLPLFAQHQMSVSLNSGIGKSALITDLESEVEMKTNISDEYCMSSNAQLNYSFQKNHWIAETGLAYNLIKGSTRETFNVYDWSNQYQYHTYAAHETRRAHYLTLPLMIHYKFNKLSIGTGIFAALLLTDYSFIQFYRDEIPNGFQQGGNRLRNFDIGANAKVHFSLNEKFSLQAMILCGFLDVSNGTQNGAVYQTLQINEASNRQLKNKQFLVGISYRIF